MVEVADTWAVPILLLVLTIPICSILALQLPGTLTAELHPHWGGNDLCEQQSQVSTTSFS